MRLPDPVIHTLRARLLRMSEQRSPDLLIGDPADPYMRRWHLIERNGIANSYLHHFRHSDDDRALHDHPWWNVSILLDNEYVEHTITAGGINHRKRYVAGDVKFRSARSAHRVELTRGPCWSLFITGPRIRDWGFHCPSRWVPWQEFTKPHNPGEIGRGCGEGEPTRNPKLPTQPLPGDA